MSEHSAKRQRLTGSFSPASPPYYQNTKTSETKTPNVHPNTPTSPPYPSMSSHSNGANTMAATGPSSVMTPPSSVHMSQQHSQSGPSANNPPPFPTPASTAGRAHSLNDNSDVDAVMEDDEDEDATWSGKKRATNHDRQWQHVLLPGGGVRAAKDVCGSELFMSAESSHELSRPHGSQNLFDLYDLNRLAGTVARNDPVTGAKTNKLRKSYENQIKRLQIAGKPKSTKMDGALMMPLQWPQEEWDAQKVQGKEIQHALSGDHSRLTPSFDSLLNSAFAGMAPGPLAPAETAKIRQYLGTDDASKAKEAPLHRPLPSAAATPNVHTPAAAPRATRPERAGSKRQYTDMSFQGYGEGFADDYAESTGGEDNAQGGMAKKRRIGGGGLERTSYQVEVGGVRR